MTESAAQPAALALPVLDEALADRLRGRLGVVEEMLAGYCEGRTRYVSDAARHLLAAGGKRFRPLLVLLAAEVGEDPDNDEVLKAACVVELTHVASLYHDDVMDEAQMRRGVPSAQNVWGNSVAILTGDLLFARASKVGAHLGERVLALQSATFERLVLGQLHETIGPGPDDDPIEHYVQVLADKTGSLIAAAAQVGVILSNAPQEYVEPVRRFGEKIGVAFQLIDDVIDLATQVDDTGKTPGTDLRAGVATLPLLYLRRAARTDSDADDLLRRLDRDVTASFYGEGDDAELTAAIAELRGHPVTQRTMDEAHRWSRDAVAALAPLPVGPVKKALSKFAETIVDRSS